MSKIITSACCSEPHFPDVPSYALIELTEQGAEHIKKVARQVRTMKSLGVEEIRCNLPVGVTLTWLLSATASMVQDAVVVNDRTMNELSPEVLDDTDAVPTIDFGIRGESICVDDRSFYISSHTKKSAATIESERIDFSDIPLLSTLLKEYGDVDYLSPAYISSANTKYVGDDVQFDPDPAVALAGNGAWVQAWLYVSDDDAGFADAEVA